jgi:hypothetical protein
MFNESIPLLKVTMRQFYIIIFIFLLASGAYAQKTPRVTKSQTKQLTPEQRMVRETNRKSKGGKKKLSMKKRVKIDKKQDKRARKIRHQGYKPLQKIQDKYSS